jgi:NAD(P)-dependent dehydrogenase (short-subunit alcohol dehydrogenase family)
MNTTKKLLLAAGLALAARELWMQRREADLTGQVVLITGGSRGLGLALAREFAAQGCRIALCARDPAELSRAEQALEEDGADVFRVCCDLREQDQVERMTQAVGERFGRIDILVANAGIIEVGPFANQATADFENAMQTNFWGAFYAISAVLPQMRARRSGRIVTISSIGGRISVPHLLPYGCAKFALTGLSEGLRAELAPDGITVTTILPGLMRTGSFVNASFKGDQAGEYAWFSVGDNVPGLTVSAERAARQIVRAVRRGEAERVIGLPYRLAALAHGLLPGLTADIAGLVSRALPAPAGPEGDTAKTGEDVRAENPSALRDALTGSGYAAAERLNEQSP